VPEEERVIRAHDSVNKNDPLFKTVLRMAITAQSKISFNPTLPTTNLRGLALYNERARTNQLQYSSANMARIR
jgi:hypothetical protein